MTINCNMITNNFCGKEYTNDRIAGAHISMKHGGVWDDVTPHNCYTCEHSSYKTDEMRAHVSSEHGINLRDVEVDAHYSKIECASPLKCDKRINSRDNSQTSEANSFISHVLSEHASEIRPSQTLVVNQDFTTNHRGLRTINLNS